MNAIKKSIAAKINRQIAPSLPVLLASHKVQINLQEAAPFFVHLGKMMTKHD